MVCFVPLAAMKASRVLKDVAFLELLLVLSASAELFRPNQVKSSGPSKAEVEALAREISDLENGVFSYKLPTSAEEYSSKSPKRFIFGKFDIVVVGSGSAGSVLANRLSEVKELKVLLLEAGGFGNNLTDVPNMYFPTVFSEYNWGHKSVPQKTACQGCVDGVMNFPRGKGIGGTSLIDGLVYSTGQKHDWDLWKDMGNYGWGYDNILPYLKKSQHYVHRNPHAPVEPAFHGTSGPLNIEYYYPNSPLLDVFLKANNEIGVPIVDYNANKCGASPAQINTKDGRRMDNGKAFVRPVLKRKNLKVLTESYVTKIRIRASDSTAVGVEFTHKGKNFYVDANKEVVVSAGAFGSPQLLMLSGVGPKSHLADLGIRVFKDAPVGETLRDHATFFGLIFETNYTEPVKPLESYVEEFLMGYGPLASPGNNQGVGFYESSFTKGTSVADIEIMMIPANATSPYSQLAFNINDETYEDLWKYVPSPNSFILYVTSLHAESFGTVKLKSRNAFDYPEINPNLLTGPNGRDVKVLLEGISFALKLVKTRAFAGVNATLASRPLRACKDYKFLSTAYWECALRQLTIELYHPMGTCPAGVNPKTSVVDPEFRVHGVRKLRVVDASVFPTTFAGHPNAPTTALAEYASDLIKEQQDTI